MSKKIVFEEDLLLKPLEAKYPLYASLLREVTLNIYRKNPSVEDLEKLAKQITKLDKNGQQLVFVIVRVHQLQDRDQEALSLPYACKEQSNGIRFDLTEFPILLQQLLLCFIPKHLSSIDENENLRPE